MPKHIKNIKSMNLFTQTLPYNSSKSTKIFRPPVGSTKNQTKTHYLFDNKENVTSSKIKKPKRTAQELGDKLGTPTF